MAAPVQLRWKEPTPRAKPIAQEIWCSHKEELGLLYQTKTLDDIMSIMKEKYSFTPSYVATILFSWLHSVSLLFAHPSVGTALIVTVAVVNTYRSSRSGAFRNIKSES